MLKVMTFNIRGAHFDDGLYRWENRAEQCLETIRQVNADLMGFQEVQDKNLSDLKEKFQDFTFFAGLPNSYEIQKRANYNLLMWRQSKFEYLDAGSFYLSDTPDVPSLGWNYNQSRVLNWVKLKARGNNTVIVHANTHLAHNHLAAREASTKLILENLSSLSISAPLILTGDFNTRMEALSKEDLKQLPLDLQKDMIARGHATQNDIYRSFLAATYRDALREGGLEVIDTFNGFRSNWPDMGHRIDWILVHGDSVHISHAQRIKAENGKYISDHYPLEVSFDLGTSA